MLLFLFLTLRPRFWERYIQVNHFFCFFVRFAYGADKLGYWMVYSSPWRSHNSRWSRKTQHWYWRMGSKVYGGWSRDIIWYYFGNMTTLWYLSRVSWNSSINIFYDRLPTISTSSLFLMLDVRLLQTWSRERVLKRSEEHSILPMTSLLRKKLKSRRKT